MCACSYEEKKSQIGVSLEGSQAVDLTMETGLTFMCFLWKLELKVRFHYSVSPCYCLCLLGQGVWEHGGNGSPAMRQGKALVEPQGR